MRTYAIRTRKPPGPSTIPMTSYLPLHDPVDREARGYETFRPHSRDLRPSSSRHVLHPDHRGEPQHRSRHIRLRPASAHPATRIPFVEEVIDEDSRSRSGTRHPVRDGLRPRSVDVMKHRIRSHTGLNTRGRHENRSKPHLYVRRVTPDEYEALIRHEDDPSYIARPGAGLPHRSVKEYATADRSLEPSGRLCGPRPSEPHGREDMGRRSQLQYSQVPLFSPDILETHEGAPSSFGLHRQPNSSYTYRNEPLDHYPEHGDKNTGPYAYSSRGNDFDTRSKSHHHPLPQNSSGTRPRVEHRAHLNKAPSTSNHGDESRAVKPNHFHNSNIEPPTAYLDYHGEQPRLDRSAGQRHNQQAYHPLHQDGTSSFAQHQPRSILKRKYSPHYLSSQARSYYHTDDTFQNSPSESQQSDSSSMEYFSERDHLHPLLDASGNSFPRDKCHAMQDGPSSKGQVPEYEILDFDDSPYTSMPTRVHSKSQSGNHRHLMSSKAQTQADRPSKIRKQPHYSTVVGGSKSVARRPNTPKSGSSHGPVPLQEGFPDQLRARSFPKALKLQTNRNRATTLNHLTGLSDQLENQNGYGTIRQGQQEHQTRIPAWKENAPSPEFSRARQVTGRAFDHLGEADSCQAETHQQEAALPRHRALKDSHQKNPDPVVENDSHSPGSSRREKEHKDRDTAVSSGPHGAADPFNHVPGIGGEKVNATHCANEIGQGRGEEICLNESLVGSGSRKPAADDTDAHQEFRLPQRPGWKRPKKSDENEMLNKVPPHVSVDNRDADDAASDVPSLASNLFVRNTASPDLRARASAVRKQFIAALNAASPTPSVTDNNMRRLLECRQGEMEKAEQGESSLSRPLPAPLSETPHNADFLPSHQVASFLKRPIGWNRSNMNDVAGDESLIHNDHCSSPNEGSRTSEREVHLAQPPKADSGSAKDKMNPSHLNEPIIAHQPSATGESTYTLNSPSLDLLPHPFPFRQSTGRLTSHIPLAILFCKTYR